jgi:hypothetical protein
MEFPKAVANSVAGVKKAIELLQIKTLSDRPIPRTMPYQIPSSETVYDSYQASRQLTKGKVEVICPLILKMKMTFTKATPIQGEAYRGDTVPVLWVDRDDKFIARTDDRYHYISVRELSRFLNHHDVHRLLCALTGRESELLPSYTKEMVEFIKRQHVSV